MLEQDIEYDEQGRMKYNPIYHANQHKPWTIQEQQYLIENHALLGTKQLSYALERTYTTISTRVYELRKQGLMPKFSAKTRASIRAKAREVANAKKIKGETYVQA